MLTTTSLNSGEIAIRILDTTRELDIFTIAIYIASDTSHISHAHEAIRLPDASSFLDISHIIQICRDHNVDALHPGYGFLSESSEFARRLSSASVIFVGPSADILQATGDKLGARELAQSCDVPVIPALAEATDDVSMIAKFGQSSGWPVMIKAVDGGGGRGIRLAKDDRQLDEAFQRAIAESPSRKVFAEKAAIGGWRHVEVQILGDGTNVRHFWERECSIQRRYVWHLPSMCLPKLRNGYQISKDRRSCSVFHLRSGVDKYGHRISFENGEINKVLLFGHLRIFSIAPRPTILFYGNQSSSPS